MTTKVIKELLSQEVQDQLNFVSGLPVVENGAPLTVAQYILGNPTVLLHKKVTDVDDTEMFQRACDAGGMWNVPDGDYTIFTVNVTKSVTFQLGTNVRIFKRADSDPGGATLNAPGVACFDVKNNGLSIAFTGGGLYDGQESTMSELSAKGLFIRINPTYDPLKGDITVHISDMKFRRGSVGYIYSVGDDVQRRYETIVNLPRCTMYATRYGRGATVEEPLGYGPVYVTGLGYTRITTTDLTMIWDRPLDTTDQYSVSGIFASYVGGSFENSGGTIVTCNGLTTAIRMGRAYNNPDGIGFGNNAIGVIDGYGRPDSITVENIYAVDSQFVTVRAKASIKEFVVKKATLINCFRGIQVGPSTSGPCRANVRIGNVVAYGGTSLPLIEVVGTSVSDTAKSAVIEDCRIEGEILNPEAHASDTVGAIVVNSTDVAVIRNPEVLDSPISGVVCAGVKSLMVDSAKVSNVDFYGISAGNGCTNVMILNPEVSNTGNIGVNYQPGATGSKMVFNSGKISNVVNYALFIGSSNVDALVTGLDMNTVTGSQRGINIAAGSTLRAYNNRSIAGIAAPIFKAATSVVIEGGNSWNPVVTFAAAAPIAGTAKIGDIVYNTAPSASGNIGWACTVSGTPGTWKAFGTIEA